MKHNLHYSRAGRVVSWAALLFSTCAWSQYQGQVTKTTKDAPALRAVAVLEWTGEEAKPGVPGKIKKSRLIPVSIFNGEKLEDAGIYLARPQPLALAGEVEYQMKKNGATVGLFDIKNAGQEMGSWVGYGEWKAPPAARPAFAATAQKLDEDDADDDKPVLHRKQHADDGQSSGSNGGSSSGTAGQNPSSGSNSGANSGSGNDSDRPVLHKKDSSDSSGTSSGNGAGNSAGNTTGGVQTNSDRPVMKKSQNRRMRTSDTRRRCPISLIQTVRGCSGAKTTRRA